MSDDRVSNELLYEVLKSIQSDVARVGARLDRVENRMGHLETLMGDIVKSDLNGGEG